MARYIDADYLDELITQLIKEGRNITRNDYKMIDSILFEFPTADVVEKERYDMLLENATIIAAALSKYQSADMVEVVRCEKCKKWRENIGGGNYGYCYRDYGLPRTTDASDYCSWWEKKERSEDVGKSDTDSNR